MDALVLEGVEVDRQRGDERLALAGLHLRDHALVQDHAADELHVEVTHAEHALGGLTSDSERLRQQVVERLAVLDALLELDGLGSKLLVGEGLERRLRVR